MIKPTVGRVVWFFAHSTQERERQPNAALIAYVHTDRLVNLAVFNEQGHPQGHLSVTLVQEGDEKPATGFYATWMPYQQGQAAKTEFVEKQLAAHAPTAT